jgi:hypothetical protein
VRNRTDRQDQERLSSVRGYWVGYALMLFLFGRLLFGALELSKTADESSHVASGYAAVARGLDGIWTVPMRGHPLLVDAWLALPVYAGQPDIPLEALEGWRTNYARYVSSFGQYLDRRGMDMSTPALFVARVQVMLLTTVLAATVWRWATDLWGHKAGLLALGVLVFDPTLLAHARLATNDVGLVAMGTLALYSVWRWLQRPSWRWALGTGVLLALTMLAKGSGVLWGAAAGLMMLSTLVRPSAGHANPAMWRLHLLAQAVSAGALSLLLLWAAYGFGWGRAGDLPIPLPAHVYWEGLLFHPNIIGQRWVYAMGQRTSGRWWWYFPLTFAIKNPLPLLIASAIGLWVIFIWRKSSRLGVLILFPLLYVVSAIVAGLNVGYRHMLPIHPFLYLAIAGGLTQLVDHLPVGQVSAGSWRSQRTVRWLVRASLAALGVWYVVSSVGIYPYEIAYLNELFGGPQAGHHYLVDSNLDWGQADHVRQAYVQTNPDTRVDPPTHKFNPEPGRYIVGASPLHGVGTADPYAYEWFRHWEPERVIDYSLLVYDVPRLEVSWVAQCDQPRTPLNETTIAEGIGQEDARSARVVQFDCTRTWVYPGGGKETGLYALHGDQVASHRLCMPIQIPCAPVLGDSFIARRLDQARISFEQEYGNRGVPFVLYEMPAHMSTARAGGQGGETYVASADKVRTALNPERPVEGPISLEGRLAFLGADAYRDGEMLDVETWWQVNDGPIARPFAVMGHLLTAEGQVLDQSDGLGISPLALTAGDIVVQRHRFPVPSTASGELWLRTGVYWADDLMRWTVDRGQTPRESPADVLLIRLAID